MSRAHRHGLIPSSGWQQFAQETIHQHDQRLAAPRSGALSR